MPCSMKKFFISFAFDQENSLKLFLVASLSATASHKSNNSQELYLVILQTLLTLILRSIMNCDPMIILHEQNEGD
mgnify:CR=1 FL=1